MNLAQAKTLAAQAAAVARAQPVDDLRRELAELRALVKQQQTQLARRQREIAELKSRAVAGTARD